MDTPPHTVGWFAEIREAIVWAATGVGAAFLGFYKLNRMAATDHKSSAADNATIAVIELLRAEVDRLAQQNLILSTTVGQLRKEVQDVREENAMLLATLNELNHGKQDNKAAS